MRGNHVDSHVEAREPDLAIGAHVGRYVILERVGNGAMGVVYLCVDSRLARPVAVKVLRENERMTEAERERTDVIVQAEQNKLRIAIELAKRQAKFDKRLHLNVSVDSSRMYLTREGALLREMPVQFGPERGVSASDSAPPEAIPRGERTVAELSDTRITLDGGTSILTSPTSLASDSTPIPPGSLRISLEDMKAIKPNLNAGMKVYFY